MKPLVIKEFTDSNAFLSNFYKHDITLNTASGNVTFVTIEHGFQAAKYKYLKGTNAAGAKFVQAIIDDPSPAKARSLGKSVKGLDVATWDSVKIQVMRDLLMLKFADTKLKGLLLGTGDAMLVEGNTHGDVFWGRCEGKGYNILGVLLMEIRGYHRMTPPF